MGIQHRLVHRKAGGEEFGKNDPTGAVIKHLVHQPSRRNEARGNVSQRGVELTGFEPHLTRSPRRALYRPQSLSMVSSEIGTGIVEKVLVAAP